LRRGPAVAACLLLTAAIVAHADDSITIEIDGVERSARVYPGKEAAREDSPLVLVFHGLGDNERNFANIVGFHRDWPEATVVYPAGRERADREGMRGWHGFPDHDENSDLAFVDRLLTELEARYRVDPERVYATGFSNGGHMTFNLLVQRPCRFAAYAPVGALGEYVSEAATPRPVIYLFGRGEPREYTESWQQTVVALARLNRATGEKREWQPGLTEFRPGPGGASTVYGLYGAGHVWPSRGNEAIVRFFREHDGTSSCISPQARAGVPQKPRRG
jgi:polyhydroxybutyrate depolymerase